MKRSVDNPCLKCVSLLKTMFKVKKITVLDNMVKSVLVGHVQMSFV